MTFLGLFLALTTAQSNPSRAALAEFAEDLVDDFQGKHWSRVETKTHGLESGLMRLHEQSHAGGSSNKLG